MVGSATAPQSLQGTKPRRMLVKGAPAQPSRPRVARLHSKKTKQTPKNPHLLFLEKERFSCFFCLFVFFFKFSVNIFAFPFHNDVCLSVCFSLNVSIHLNTGLYFRSFDGSFWRCRYLPMFFQRLTRLQFLMCLS